MTTNSVASTGQLGDAGGLSVEAQPFQPRPEQVIVDLRFYEPVCGTRRLVGRNIDSPQITNRKRAGTVKGGVGSVTVMRGRKAYFVESLVTLTFTWKC
jgi:hypothetical protein